MSLRTLPASVLLCLSAGAAVAQTADEPRLILSGYLFASALTGRASSFEGLPPADLDLSFGDVLEDLEGGIMGAADYRFGGWSLLGDLMLTQVRPGGTLPGPLASNLELRQRSATLQATLLREILATPVLSVDLGAGLRYWHLDNKVSSNSEALDYRTASQDRDWVDPVLAARLRARLDEAWSLTLVADHGFSGVGSDETWQLIGTLDYRWTERLSLRMGYRVLSTDLRDDGFVYDVTMRGPVIGLSYRF
ncbi:hypothetical protein [Rhodobacter sp. CZR27]|uniref:hypothetical protein n=1 Tax=Rhodobacter sp. CZR27 TaxID=2033869 RepID=UPI001E5854E9|nr:hypothetical protein [Rhodobacter sp. CZR27]